VIDRVDDRPAPLAGVRDVAPDALEVVALLVEGPLGQLAEPGANDRAAVPEPETSLMSIGNFDACIRSKPSA
jgi:hypothetical protein